MKIFTLVLIIAATAAAQETRREIVNSAPTPAEDAKPNSDKVPDVYAIPGQFDRVLVLRFKYNADLLAGIRARRPDGELFDLDRALLRSVPLAAGWNALLGKVRTELSLEAQYKELIMLRVAALNGAEFEWRAHRPLYLAAGGTAEKCEALRAPGMAALFDDREQALLALADQSTRHVAVDAAVIEKLNALFGETKTVEAVAASAGAGPPDAKITVTLC